MPEQLDLEEFVRWRSGDVTAELIACCREVVAIKGLKHCADKLGTKDSVLAHALSGNSRHPMRLDWIEWFNANSPSDRIAEVLARQRGKDLVDRVVMTPEEELESLKRAMAETLGPEVRRIISERARKAGIKP